MGGQEMAGRFRIEDVRWQATALGTAAGLTAPRASALAAHLLWFDQAGYPAHGLMSLPDWLGRIASGELNPTAEGSVIRPEHSGTAILDGQHGLAPLILSRAAGLAVEKARDTGIGIVRVCGIAPGGPATEVASEVAIGPHAAVVIGPGPSWTVALPSPDGLPLLLDSALAEGGEIAGARAASAVLGPISAVLVPEGGWLVLALTVPALEPLASFHERVAAQAAVLKDPRWLTPQILETRRRDAREQGIAIGAEAIGELNSWAARLGVSSLA